MADDCFILIDKEELPFSRSPCIKISMHTIVLRVCLITPPFMSSLTRNPRKSFVYICVFFLKVINYVLVFFYLGQSSEFGVMERGF